MIKHSTSVASWRSRHRKRLNRSSPSLGKEEANERANERTNERDSGGKINTKAYEDTEGWRESAASRLTAARGRGQRDRGLWRRGGGWHGGGNGCEGDVLTQPSVSWGKNGAKHIIIKGVGGCWSGQALLFPPAPPVTYWEKASVLPMQSCDGLSSAPDTGGKS